MSAASGGICAKIGRPHALRLHGNPTTGETFSACVICGVREGSDADPFPVPRPSWDLAHERNSARIVGHRKFAKLVLAVAWSEQPGFPRLSWMRRNSPTYGAWVHRGNDGRGRGDGGAFNPRALRLADLIANDLPDVVPGSPFSERSARVYGEAREWVRLRACPGRRSR